MHDVHVCGPAPLPTWGLHSRVVLLGPFTTIWDPFTPLPPPVMMFTSVVPAPLYLHGVFHSRVVLLPLPTWGLSLPCGPFSAFHYHMGSFYPPPPTAGQEVRRWSAPALVKKLHQVAYKLLRKWFLSVEGPFLCKAVKQKLQKLLNISPVSWDHVVSREMRRAGLKSKHVEERADDYVSSNHSVASPTLSAMICPTAWLSHVPRPRHQTACGEQVLVRCWSLLPTVARSVLHLSDRTAGRPRMTWLEERRIACPTHAGSRCSSDVSPETVSRRLAASSPQHESHSWARWSQATWACHHAGTTTGQSWRACSDQQAGCRLSTVVVVVARPPMMTAGHQVMTWSSSITEDQEPAYSRDASLPVSLSSCSSNLLSSKTKWSQSTSWMYQKQ